MRLFRVYTFQSTLSGLRCPLTSLETTIVRHPMPQALAFNMECKDIYGTLELKQLARVWVNRMPQNIQAMGENTGRSSIAHTMASD